jgi:hypothetical protein
VTCEGGPVDEHAPRRLARDLRLAARVQPEDAEQGGAGDDDDRDRRGGASPPPALPLPRLLDQRLRIDERLGFVFDPGEAWRE